MHLFFYFDVRFSARIVFFARFCLVLFGISLTCIVIVFLSVFRCFLFLFFDFVFQEARYLQCAVAGVGAGQPDGLCECKLQRDLVHMQSGRLDSLKLESHSHDMVLGPATTWNFVQIIGSIPHRGSVLGDVLATSALS